MIRTEVYRSRAFYTAEGKELDTYCINNKQKTESYEKNNFPLRNGKSINELYPIEKESKITFEVVDELFKLVAKVVEIHETNAKGEEVYNYIATDEERKELVKMLERVKHGLELVEAEENYMNELAEAEKNGEL